MSFVYEEHLPLDSDRVAGAYSGLLKVIALNRKTAYVKVPGVKVDILIRNEEHRNRAIHGDKVALELLPTAEWEPIRVVATEAFPLSDVDTDQVCSALKNLWGPEDDDRRQEMAPHLKIVETSAHPIDEQSAALQLQPTAKVIAILQGLHRKTWVGCLTPPSNLRMEEKLPNSTLFVVFRPHDPRYPFLRVERHVMPLAFIERPMHMENHIFLAEVSDNWPAKCKSPLASSVRSIGEMGVIQHETEALLAQFGIDSGPFSEDSLQSLQQFTNSAGESSWKIPNEEITKRRDLRGHRIFTIDPSTAKDLDDALHITSLGDGTYELGVHIADVSFFLRPNTALDAEARERATSVYLVQRVVPMLPSTLCEDLCSLNPNVDRLAFSCICKIYTQYGCRACEHVTRENEFRWHNDQGCALVRKNGHSELCKTRLRHCSTND